jgi:hypothetical protein
VVLDRDVLFAQGGHALPEERGRQDNALDADLVCFTGDLVADAGQLTGALEILSEIRKPLFGVPGNHDHQSPRTSKEVGSARGVTKRQFRFSCRNALPSYFVGGTTGILNAHAVWQGRAASFWSAAGSSIVRPVAAA